MQQTDMNLRKIINAIVRRTFLIDNDEILKHFLSPEVIVYIDDFFLLNNLLFSLDSENPKLNEFTLKFFTYLVPKISKHDFTTFDKMIFQNTINSYLKDEEKTKYNGYIDKLIQNKSKYIYLLMVGKYKYIESLFNFEKSILSETNLNQKIEINNNIVSLLHNESLVLNSFCQKEILQLIDQFNTKTEDLSKCYIHSLKSDIIAKRKLIFIKLRLFLFMNILKS